MKKLITPLVIVFIAAVIGFTLFNNKQEMGVKAEQAMKTSEYIPVRTQMVAKTSNSISFMTNGSFIPSQELILKSEGNGKVIRILKDKGDHVNKGDVIARLDDELLQAELSIAETKFNQYTRDLGRYENLAGTEAITEKQLEEIQNAHKMGASEIKMIKRRLSNTVITAPISGYINEDFIEIGTLLNTGMDVVEIVNVMPLKLVVQVAEMEIANIKVGDEVQVKVGVIPDQQFNGKVSFTSSKGDASLKYQVEIELKETSDKIKPGMFAYATFEYPTMEAVLIERTSLIRGIKNPEVFILEDGKAVLKKIKISQLGDSKLMLLEGLDIGDKVITSGLINLKDGMAVTELQ